MKPSELFEALHALITERVPLHIWGTCGVGKSQIVADRSSGAIYVNVGGVMHPALNLASARLVSGQANNPTFVKATELTLGP